MRGVLVRAPRSGRAMMALAARPQGRRERTGAYAVTVRAEEGGAASKVACANGRTRAIPASKYMPGHLHVQ
jgi:hypothetical protein